MSNAAKAPKPKIFNKQFVLLMILSLTTTFSYSIISTLIASYSTDVLGASLSFAGIIAGAYSFSALVMRPVAGFAADVLSKRNLCLYSSIATFIVMILYAIVPNPGSMLAVRILHGVSFGIGGTANLAMASMVIPKERLSEGLGYYGLGQIFSQAFGPAIGVELREAFGFAGMFYSLAALTFVGVIIVGFFFKSEKVEKPTEKRKITIGNFIAVECIMYALIGGMFSMTNGVVNAFLKQFAEEREIAQYALFFTANAVVMFFIRTFLGKFFDRIRLLWVVDISLLISVASMVLLGKSHALAPLLIAAALKALGQGGGQISLQSACIKSVDATRIGIATSTYYIGADVGNTVGPMLGGAIADVTHSYETMYITIGVLIFASFLIFHFYEKNREKKRAAIAE